MPLTNFKRREVPLTDSLWAAIDAARGDLSRGAFIENTLWRSSQIKATKIQRQPRPGVGKYDRAKNQNG